MKKTTCLLFVIMILLLGAQSSFAGKHGIFLDLATGSGDAEWDSDTSSWDIDSSSIAIGYVFDTDPDPSKVFNYRLNVGVIRHDIEDDYGVTLESVGIYAESIFGFALVRKNDFRWWAGPLVRLGFYSGEVDDSDMDANYAEFALGLVTGMNFTAGSTVVSPSLGVRFTGYAGEGEYAGMSEDLEANSTNFFFNLTFLF